MGVSRTRNQRSASLPEAARVRFCDAATVRERVEAHALKMRLRGARRHVLAAVLKLLCGWSRITDDRVGLPPDRRTDRRGRWTSLRPQDDRARAGGPGGR